MLAAEAEDFMDDYFAVRRKDAVRGSLRLKRAILRFHRAPPAKLRRSRQWWQGFEAREKARKSIVPIIERSAAFFNVTADGLVGPRGSRELSRIRQVVMYVVREKTACSYPDIGKAFGGRHHTTVLYGCELVESDDEAKASAVVLMRSLSA